MLYDMILYGMKQYNGSYYLQPAIILPGFDSACADQLHVAARLRLPAPGVWSIELNRSKQHRIE
jgi:hypothetical protein